MKQAEEDAKDACKSGKVEAEAGQNVSGGGKETINRVYMYEGRVTVTCEPAPLDEKGHVTFCPIYGKCQILEKDSQEGRNVMELYEVVKGVGIPSKGGLGTEARYQDVAGALFTPTQLSAIEDDIIGKSFMSSPLDYRELVNDIGTSAASSNAGHASLRSAADSVQDTLAFIAAREEATNPPLPIQPIPRVWPNWMEVASEPDPTHITDESDPFPRSIEPISSPTLGGAGLDPTPGITGFGSTFAPANTTPSSPQMNIFNSVNNYISQTWNWFWGLFQ